MKKNNRKRSQYFFVIKQMVSREVKRKYARSYLGIAWSVLNPLLTMAVMAMIFSTVFKHSIENYPMYYLTASLFWQFFSSATQSAMTALVDNRTLLYKVKLTKQTFVISRVFTALTNFGYTCIAYVLMMLVFRIKPSIYMLFFPVDVFFMLLFSMGLGYVLSILYVFFADIKYLYSVLLTLWMYMSALFYPVDRLSTVMQYVVNMNPVYNYIRFARDIMLYGNIPEFGVWLKIIIWGGFSFTFGYIFFRKNENLVMQRI